MKKINILLLFLICFSAEAQWYDVEKMPKKVQLIYSAALEALQNSDWTNAKTLLQRVINTDGNYVDAWLTLGGMYGQLKKYDSAVYYYQKGIALDTVYGAIFMLPLSINQAGLGQFNAAKASVNKLLSIPGIDPRTAVAASYRLETYQFALDFSERHNGNSNINLQNMGDSINSAASEYYPSVTIDDSILVFTRMSGLGRAREDFASTEKYDGMYKKATVLNTGLQNEPLKGGLSISQDGQWLIYAANVSGNGFGDFDIYMSYKTAAGWSLPVNLGKNVNSTFWESSPSLSSDNQSLYFSSNRNGGYGGKDLYMCRRLPNGNWGAAENMGENINTTADDLAPFIHADNQTLYFTSGGHKGYGGSDIFLCRKGPGGIWSEPENLGYPINTIENEGSMTVTANGKTAYFASNAADSRGLLDLYSFKMPVYAQPQKTCWIKGSVTNAVSHKGIMATIELAEMKNKLVLENISTNDSGYFLVTLPVGKFYTFTVRQKGYLFYSDYFDVNEITADHKINIELQPIAVNKRLVLKNILFESNTFVLSAPSFTELNKLLQLLQENPLMKIEIGGHTDSTGTTANNLKLSTNRAKAVLEYLVSKGIAPDKMRYKGYGAAKPIADNASEQGKALNRRTEILVTGL